VDIDIAPTELMGGGEVEGVLEDPKHHRLPSASVGS